MHARVCVCVHVFLTWHADAGVIADLIQTSGVVLAGVRAALVHILLAARSHVATCAVTDEGALRVLARAAVLTRVRPS